MLDSLPAWAAHSEHQEVWAGSSWSSIAFEVRSLLLPGVQDPSKSVLLHDSAPDTGGSITIMQLHLLITHLQRNCVNTHSCQLS
jgi:hypothetical protein